MDQIFYGPNNCFTKSPKPYGILCYWTSSNPEDTRYTRFRYSYHSHYYNTERGWLTAISDLSKQENDQIIIPFLNCPDYFPMYQLPYEFYLPKKPELLF